MTSNFCHYRDEPLRSGTWSHTTAQVRPFSERLRGASDLVPREGECQALRRQIPGGGLWFVFGGLFTLFEPEFQQSGLAFRLGNVLQRERARQAIFIERPLLGVAFLEGFRLQNFPIRIGYPSLGTQEVDLDGLEGKDFG